MIMVGSTWECVVLNFRTVHDLNLAITKKLYDIRQLDVDLVVGIPRSGMLPASLIATHLQFRSLVCATQKAHSATG